ncbi:glycerol-3-phosphate 1-O-acyltransferase PlsY [Sphingomicrobium sediminis]|uniref:Glycerol-3-phosphate acyltransferase n=1 Tax=Sphingomicrobium sediminis TaxID=2950949 RepID=A0A9X2EHZ5_9SPHN|nr:glycerol-3-phosphate 1-O-acyltransferase PlsY [Sphingomicrobium sediminis]MCM8557086.1 glycerol-3-phosphate 1-O-acyltransferase PlsY [Sphingomicrobium sediminis]
MIDAYQFAPLLIGYLLGSIPFGIILVRLAGKGDLRATGSGNIGATNAVRAAGKGIGALVLFLDLLKGVAAVLVARHFFPDNAELFGATGALLGHLYPIWLKFRGGKGVATFFGILLALNWIYAAIAFGAWLFFFLVTRISAAGGLMAAVAAPVTALVRGDDTLFPMLLGFTLLIWWKHRANIARILSGSEPRFGAKRATAEAAQNGDDDNSAP